MLPPLDLLYEDNHLLVVNKRAMLPTMGVVDGRPTLLEECKAYLKEKYKKPGNVYLGIVSRLDAPVTGVVVLARTSKAAARLTRQYKEHRVDKVYLALVPHKVDPPEAELCDLVRKDERHRRMHIVLASHPEAQKAILRYKTRKTHGGLTLLEVQLITGRKHQIRVQLAHADHPIVGDRKYGSDRPFPEGIALHSRRTELEHPVLQKRLTFLAPLPPAWPRFASEGA